MSAGDGWVKFYRQALHNGWLKSHKLWAFWSYCLLKASHKQASVMVGYQRVSLEPGQFVFGRKKAAEDLGMTEREVRTCLTSLISTSNLTSNPTNKFSVITIVNWSSYQDTSCGGDQQDDQQTAQRATSKRPASDHIQEGEEGKKEKKQKKITPLTPPGERIDFLLPAWIDQKAWDGFVDMRTKIKKPLTSRAVELTIAKLDELRGKGHDPDEILNTSTMNSYQGLFEPKANPIGRDTGKAYKDPFYGAIL